VASDFVGRCADRKGDGRADVDGDFAKMGETAVFALHFPNAVEAHGNDGYAKTFSKEANAALERCHAAVFGVVDFAFGENEDAVAVIGGFAGEAETFAEAGKLGKGENIEEKGSEPVAKLIGPPFCKKPITWRAAHILQRFTSHGGSEVVAETRRQRGENQADVGAAGDVIRNDEDGSAQTTEILAADN
jgi:hypothetical protein